MAIPVPHALPALRRPSRQRRHGSTKEFWPTDHVFDDLRMLQVVALDCLPKAETVVGHGHHSMRAAPTRPNDHCQTRIFAAFSPPRGSWPGRASSDLCVPRAIHSLTRALESTTKPR